MKHPVKVSVIIPVYNVEDYLPFALQSCIDQTLKDVEFICVNDGSTDNSLRVLESFSKEDKRIKIIDKENAGVSSARNVGLDASCGKWVMFLDPDDYLAKNACERVWIEGEEGRTDIINFGTEIVPKQPKPTPWHYYALDVWTKRYYEFTPNALFGEPSAKPFLWHQAFSRDLLNRSKVRFDEGLKLAEDMTFLISIYPHANFIAHIQDKLYNYRWIRANSAMQRFRDDFNKKIKQHLTAVQRIAEYWNQNGFTEKYGADLLGWSLDFILHDLENCEGIGVDEKSIYRKKFKDILSQYGLLQYSKELDKRGKRYLKLLNAKG